MQRVPNSIAAQALGTAASVIYTTPVATITTLANVSFNNTSASPVTVTVYNVPPGGSPGTTNQVVSAFSIAAGKPYVPPQLIGLNMAPGSTLQALAGTAGVVVAQGGVYETSGS